MDNVNETLGSRIFDLLNKNGMTQRSLAEAIGVTEVSVSRYISGQRIPKGPIVANIALVLHTTTDYLLGQESDEDPEFVYCQVQRAIGRYAKNWSQKQKAELVNAIFGVV